ncbi:MAG: ABC transporter permease [Dehalococcoidales bacterium]|nr:ABC transporter permease [Dehalococcoidales bacterium]
MTNIGLIAGKEFRSYLKSPMAYIVAFIFLLFTGSFFIFYLSSNNYNDTSIRGFIDPLSIFGLGGLGNIFLIIFAVLITMRLISEEKKLGTWELLLTSPVKDSDVVIGKFLGSLGLLAGILALTLYYPIILYILGSPDFGPIVAGYLGLFLFGAATLAIGIFGSSITANQIVAAVVSGAIMIGLWIVGILPQRITAMPTTIKSVLNYIALSGHSSGFAVGIFDTRDIIYYLSITVLFLYLAVRSLETSRWN